MGAMNHVVVRSASLIGPLNPLGVRVRMQIDGRAGAPREHCNHRLIPHAKENTARSQTLNSRALICSFALVAMAAKKHEACRFCALRRKRSLARDHVGR
jgi:hypothetical protein